MGGLTRDCLERLSLHSLDGFLSEDVGDVTISPWILALGIYHRTRKRPSLMGSSNYRLSDLNLS